MARNLQIALTVGLGHQVLEQQLRRVVHQTRGFLQAGAGGRNLPARQRGVAHGSGISLQYQHLRTSLIGGQGGNGAAGPRTNDENLHAAGIARLVGREHRHVNVL